jgi:hypothetical protein
MPRLHKTREVYLFEEVYIPDATLHNHRCENLKSYVGVFIYLSVVYLTTFSVAQTI